MFLSPSITPSRIFSDLLSFIEESWRNFFIKSLYNSKSISSFVILAVHMNNIPF